MPDTSVLRAVDAIRAVRRHIRTQVVQRAHPDGFGPPTKVVRARREPTGSLAPSTKPARMWRDSVTHQARTAMAAPPSDRSRLAGSPTKRGRVVHGGRAPSAPRSRWPPPSPLGVPDATGGGHERITATLAPRCAPMRQRRPRARWGPRPQAGYAARGRARPRRRGRPPATHVGGPGRAACRERLAGLARAARTAGEWHRGAFPSLDRWSAGPRQRSPRSFGECPAPRAVSFARWASGGPWASGYPMTSRFASDASIVLRPTCGSLNATDTSSSSRVRREVITMPSPQRPWRTRSPSR